MTAPTMLLDCIIIIGSIVAASVGAYGFIAARAVLVAPGVAFSGRLFMRSIGLIVLAIHERRNFLYAIFVIYAVSLMVWSVAGIEYFSSAWRHQCVVSSFVNLTSHNNASAILNPFEIPALRAVEEAYTRDGPVWNAQHEFATWLYGGNMTHGDACVEDGDRTSLVPCYAPLHTSYSQVFCQSGRASSLPFLTNKECPAGVGAQCVYAPSPASWFNFDKIGPALVVMFQMASLDNWTRVMYALSDTESPSLVALFFTAFLLIQRYLISASFAAIIFEGYRTTREIVLTAVTSDEEEDIDIVAGLLQAPRTWLRGVTVCDQACLWMLRNLPTRRLRAHAAVFAQDWLGLPLEVTLSEEDRCTVHPFPESERAKEQQTPVLFGATDGLHYGDLGMDFSVTDDLSPVRRARRRIFTFIRSLPYRGILFSLLTAELLVDASLGRHVVDQTVYHSTLATPPLVTPTPPVPHAAPSYAPAMWCAADIFGTIMSVIVAFHVVLVGIASPRPQIGMMVLHIAIGVFPLIFLGIRGDAICVLDEDGFIPLQPWMWTPSLRIFLIIYQLPLVPDLFNHMSMEPLFAVISVGITMFVVAAAASMNVIADIMPARSVYSFASFSSSIITIFQVFSGDGWTVPMDVAMARSPALATCFFFGIFIIFTWFLAGLYGSIIFEMFVDVKEVLFSLIVIMRLEKHDYWLIRATCHAIPTVISLVESLEVIANPVLDRDTSDLLGHGASDGALGGGGGLSAGGSTGCIGGPSGMAPHSFAFPMSMMTSARPAFGGPSMRRPLSGPSSFSSAPHLPILSSFSARPSAAADESAADSVGHRLTGRSKMLTMLRLAMLRRHARLRKAARDGAVVLGSFRTGVSASGSAAVGGGSAPHRFAQSRYMSMLASAQLRPRASIIATPEESARLAASLEEDTNLRERDQEVCDCISAIVHLPLGRHYGNLLSRLQRSALAYVQRAADAADDPPTPVPPSDTPHGALWHWFADRSEWAFFIFPPPTATGLTGVSAVAQRFRTALLHVQLAAWWLRFTILVSAAAWATLLAEPAASAFGEVISPSWMPAVDRITFALFLGELLLDAIAQCAVYSGPIYGPSVLFRTMAVDHDDSVIAHPPLLLTWGGIVDTLVVGASAVCLVPGLERWRFMRVSRVLHIMFRLAGIRRLFVTLHRLLIDIMTLNGLYLLVMACFAVIAVKRWHRAFDYCTDSAIPAGAILHHVCVGVFAGSPNRPGDGAAGGASWTPSTSITPTATPTVTFSPSPSLPPVVVLAAGGGPLYPRVIATAAANFDDFPSAMLTLLQASTTAGWATPMMSALASRGRSRQPGPAVDGGACSIRVTPPPSPSAPFRSSVSSSHSPDMSIVVFFFLFFIVAVMTFVALYVSAVVDSLLESEHAYAIDGAPVPIAWYDMLKRLRLQRPPLQPITVLEAQYSCKAKGGIHQPPTKKIHGPSIVRTVGSTAISLKTLASSIAAHKHFEYAVAALLALNLLLRAARSADSSLNVHIALLVADIAFGIIFFLEACVRLAAYGRAYFMRPSNVLDFAVIVLYVVMSAAAVVQFMGRFTFVMEHHLETPASSSSSAASAAAAAAALAPTAVPPPSTVVAQFESTRLFLVPQDIIRALRIVALARLGKFVLQLPFVRVLFSGLSLCFPELLSLAIATGMTVVSYALVGLLLGNVKFSGALHSWANFRSMAHSGLAFLQVATLDTWFALRDALIHRPENHVCTLDPTCANNMSALGATPCIYNDCGVSSFGINFFLYTFIFVIVIIALNLLISYMISSLEFMQASPTYHVISSSFMAIFDDTWSRTVGNSSTLTRGDVVRLMEHLAAHHPDMLPPRDNMRHCNTHPVTIPGESLNACTARFLIAMSYKKSARSAAKEYWLIPHFDEGGSWMKSPVWGPLGRLVNAWIERLRIQMQPNPVSYTRDELVHLQDHAEGSEDRVSRKASCMTTRTRRVATLKKFCWPPALHETYTYHNVLEHLCYCHFRSPPMDQMLSEGQANALFYESAALGRLIAKKYDRKATIRRIIDGVRVRQRGAEQPKTSPTAPVQHRRAATPTGGDEERALPPTATTSLPSFSQPAAVRFTFAPPAGQTGASEAAFSEQSATSFSHAGGIPFIPVESSDVYEREDTLDRTIRETFPTTGTTTATTTPAPPVVVGGADDSGDGRRGGDGVGASSARQAAALGGTARGEALRHAVATLIPPAPAWDLAVSSLTPTASRDNTAAERTPPPLLEPARSVALSSTREESDAALPAALLSASTSVDVDAPIASSAAAVAADLSFRASSPAPTPSRPASLSSLVVDEEASRRAIQATHRRQRTQMHLTFSTSRLTLL